MALQNLRALRVYRYQLGSDFVGDPSLYLIEDGVSVHDAVCRVRELMDESARGLHADMRSDYELNVDDDCPQFPELDPVWTWPSPNRWEMREATVGLAVDVELTSDVWRVLP